MTNPNCHIGDLAYWTWSGIVAESAHTQVPVTAFVPGCYYTNGLATDTVCVPQNDSTYDLCPGGVPCDSDSLGDRLMSPLAYRYISPCEEGRVSYVSCEYLAVTQTVQEDTTYSSGYAHRATAVRYYTFSAPVSPSTSPTLVYSGEFGDGTYSQYYWMPSNAIDEDENIAYTFSVGNGATYASPYMARIDLSNTQSTPAQTVTPNGADASDTTWGEYVSVSVAPDGITFWGTGNISTPHKPSVLENQAAQRPVVGKLRYLPVKRAVVSALSPPYDSFGEGKGALPRPSQGEKDCDDLPAERAPDGPVEG